LTSSHSLPHRSTVALITSPKGKLVDEPRTACWTCRGPPWGMGDEWAEAAPSIDGCRIGPDAQDRVQSAMVKIRRHGNRNPVKAAATLTLALLGLHVRRIACVLAEAEGSIGYDRSLPRIGTSASVW